MVAAIAEQVEQHLTSVLIVAVDVLRDRFLKETSLAQGRSVFSVPVKARATLLLKLVEERWRSIELLNDLTADVLRTLKGSEVEEFKEWCLQEASAFRGSYSPSPTSSSRSRSKSREEPRGSRDPHPG